jgi:hypothetical protein
MRKRFEQQLVLGQLLIQDAKIPTAKRNGALPALCAALKEVFVTPQWNEEIFAILEQKIYPSNNDTGRPGMNLWQIFVLSQVRLCNDLSYDDLHYLANQDVLIRQLMGVETSPDYDKHSSLDKTIFTFQNILDNVSLLDDKTLKEINKIIVCFGHQTFKKNEAEALALKTDSFVVESDVHFPTDYNLLWDCARKCLDIIIKLEKQNQKKIPNWRKINDWHKQLKNKMRALGKASSGGGQGKAERLRKATEDYLAKANALLNKLKNSKDNLPQTDIKSIFIVKELENFMSLLEKQIDLLERRLIKEEKIPHEEKLFSLFEQYTEWVSKEKKHSSVELGKKVGITTDQYHLIIDYQVMENESDSQIVTDLVKCITSSYKINSWSFDKGYWHKDNKDLLSQNVETLVMPKKGKCNTAEMEEQSKSLFRKLRNKHSAVESNINELERRGLNRCPDRGNPNFKRYVGLAVCAYNLKKIGEELVDQIRKKEQSSIRKKAA